MATSGGFDVAVRSRYSVWIKYNGPWGTCILLCNPSSEILDMLFHRSFTRELHRCCSMPVRPGTREIHHAPTPLESSAHTHPRALFVSGMYRACASSLASKWLPIGLAASTAPCGTGPTPNDGHSEHAHPQIMYHQLLRHSRLSSQAFFFLPRVRAAFCICLAQGL